MVFIILFGVTKNGFFPNGDNHKNVSVRNNNRDNNPNAINIGGYLHEPN